LEWGGQVPEMRGGGHLDLVHGGRDPHHLRQLLVVLRAREEGGARVSEGVWLSLSLSLSLSP
jgi:hypothetical protein